jgi:aryl-alcohol dehydrogenase-like predicted oxidoreductase
MKYANLGRTGLKVSRFCLGTMNFGPFTEEKDALPILDRALELGINFVDSANVYGWHKGKGLTESIIGRWMAAGSGRRDQIVLATKVYAPMSDRPNERGLSAYHIRRACEDSLKRLQTDHIDLYQMHHVDRSTPWEETWQAMEQLVREGKVIYVGSSNFAGFHIAKAQAEAEKRNFMGLVSEQCMYNLGRRTVELEVLPACRDFGLGVIPYSPLLGGMLAGVSRRQAEGRGATEEQVRRCQQYKAQLDAYETLCDGIGEKPADVAMAWLLANPVITSPIIGPRTVEQLDETLRALEIETSADVLARLNEIWPGPGGEAPEAFAW